MRTPPHISEQFLAEAVAQYLREIERIRRMKRRLIHEAITYVYQEQGVPVPEGAAMEAYIDELQALLDAGHHNQEQVLQCIAEIEVT